MEERTKQIMRRYLIREFDEVHRLESPELAGMTRDEAIEEVQRYVAESYVDGHEGVYHLMDLPVVAVTAALVAKAVFRKVAGKTFEQRIEELFESGEVTLEKLQRIAVTDGHRAYVEGQTDAAKAIEQDEGITLYKRWDATMDEVTRFTHRLLNGQIKRTDEMFTTVNGSAYSPGLFGVPEEDVNCRCILTFISY